MGNTCCQQRQEMATDTILPNQLYKELSHYIKQSEEESINSLIDCRDYKKYYVTQQYVTDHMQTESEASYPKMYGSAVYMLIARQVISELTIIEPIIIRTLVKHLSSEEHDEVMWNAMALHSLARANELKGQVKDYFEVTEMIKIMSSNIKLRNQLGNLLVHLFWEELNSDRNYLYMKSIECFLDDFNPDIKAKILKINIE